MANPLARVAARSTRSSAMMVGLLLGIYAVLLVVTSLVWSSRGVYTVTGDEPHYLVMANSLIQRWDMELSWAYWDEFSTNAIFTSGLGAPGSPLEPPQAHVVSGANGYYSWHGWGVPFLVALPYALAGVAGAKALMALLGALVVIVTWRISGVFFPADRFRTEWPRFFSVLAVAVAYPVVPAATQVYPDMVAGLVCLGGIWFLLSRDLPRRGATLAAYAFMLAYLPWLGTKFAITAIILLAAMAWSVGRDDVRRLVWVGPPVVVSGALLLAYHLVAFGRLSGPPAEGALEASRTSLMVGLGLIFDQSQGSLLQNPVLWAALLGLIPFVQRFRFAGIIWVLVFVSIWIPSAMHVGWYGLGSFVGRYSWALSLLLMVPALLGLSWLALRARRTFALLIGLALLFHLLVYGLTTFTGGAGPSVSLGLELYTKPAATWLESYSIFYFPAQNWFPAFYNDEWAFTFITNGAWLLFAIGILLVSVRQRLGLALALAGVLAILISGVVSTPGDRTEWIAGDVRSTGQPGYLTAEPVRQMRQGPYAWSVDYTASADPSVTVGKWELVETAIDAVVASGELMGTSDRKKTEVVEIPYFSLQPREYLLRVAHYGDGDMVVHRTGVLHE